MAASGGRNVSHAESRSLPLMRGLSQNILREEQETRFRSPSNGDHEARLQEQRTACMEIQRQVEAAHERKA